MPLLIVTELLPINVITGLLLPTAFPLLLFPGHEVVTITALYAIAWLPEESSTL